MHTASKRLVLSITDTCELHLAPCEIWRRNIYLGFGGYGNYLQKAGVRNRIVSKKLANISNPDMRLV